MSTFKNVMSAELIRYNANSSGRSTGDCVKRALSLAFDIPYTEIAKELLSVMKEKRRDRWNIPSVYNVVIENHDPSSKSVLVNEDLTLAEFADTTGNSGTWLVHTGDRPSKPNHLVCVIDGTIYDSWDSTQKYVCSYQPVSINIERHFSEIDIHDYVDEILQTCQEIGRKILDKYSWSEYVTLFNATAHTKKLSKYECRIDYMMTLKPREYYSRSTGYDFEFNVVFTPSTTEEEAHKIIKQTIQTRLYDRLYSINQQEKKRQEAFEAAGEQIVRPSNLGSREIRFWNSLPGKIQAIIQDIRIDRPGEYHDSYTVRVKPQWGETTYAGSVWLETYDAYEMKELLDEYLKNGTTEYDY